MALVFYHSGQNRSTTMLLLPPPKPRTLIKAHFNSAFRALPRTNPSRTLLRVLRDWPWWNQSHARRPGTCYQLKWACRGQWLPVTPLIETESANASPGFQKHARIIFTSATSKSGVPGHRSRGNRFRAELACMLAKDKRIVFSRPTNGSSGS